MVVRRFLSSVARKDCKLPVWWKERFFMQSSRQERFQAQFPVWFLSSVDTKGSRFPVQKGPSCSQAPCVVDSYFVLFSPVGRRVFTYM